MTPAQQTRAVYLFDSLLESDDSRCAEQLTFYALSYHLDKWWRFAAPRRWACPALAFGNGDTTFAWGRTVIVLTPGNRNLLSLAHEIAHCLGYGSKKNPHGPGFIRRYFRLLRHYAGVPQITILAYASLAGVRF
jgi:hypothetical protein